MRERRFAATVRYDGTDLSGSQIQPGVRTVQGEIEGAAGVLFQAPSRVSLAGRTDAGVHARGQVVAFSAETLLDAPVIERALNALLPVDIAVRAVREVAPGFDPRRAAVRRRYRYTVLQGPTRDPLRRRTAWHLSGPIDLESMGRAAGALIGERDFAACAGPVERGRTTVRRVFRAEWTSAGCMLRFDIEANAFLPHMVRRLVGALERVGRRALEVDEFVGMLEAARTGTLGPVAPAHGLCLQQVRYDEGYAP